MSRLVLALHGTRSVHGRETAVELGRRVQAVTGRPTGVGFVDVAEPALRDVVRAESVVVPCFLGRGYHVDVDVAAVAERGACRVTKSLVEPGEVPPPELLDAVRARIDEAGGPGQAVVLGWAGSSSATSRAQAEASAEALARQWGVPVVTATPVTADDTVDQLRRSGAEEVALATYLLAPGFFADRLASVAADRVSAPIGIHPRLVDLIVRRVAEAG